jgi:chromosome segregation ATPase
VNEPAWIAAGIAALALVLNGAIVAWVQRRAASSLSIQNVWQKLSAMESAKDECIGRLAKAEGELTVATGELRMAREQLQEARNELARAENKIGELSVRINVLENGGYDPEIKPSNRQR